MLESIRRTIAVAAISTIVLATPAILAAADDPRPWVLLPSNIEDVPREYLADGGEVVDAALAVRLESNGIHFVTLPLVEGLRRWTLSVKATAELLPDAESFSAEHFERAEREFASTLLREFNARGLIWPDIHERNATREGRFLVWDGVGRNLEGSSEKLRVSWPSKGSSLRVRILDSDGTIRTDRYRGIEPVHRFKLLERKMKGRFRHIWYEFPVRADLFSDAGLLDRVIDRLVVERLPR